MTQKTIEKEKGSSDLSVRLLWVDNNKFYRERIISGYFEFMFPMYACDFAGNSEEVLDLLEKNDYTIVMTSRFLDDNISGGLNLTKKIKENYKNIKTILTTGYYLTEEELKEYGVDLFYDMNRNGTRGIKGMVEEMIHSKKP